MVPLLQAVLCRAKLTSLLQVEIISIDKSYSTDKKVMDPNYSPKVSTWGVFERPANISEAYGGGRTIRAGTPLEDPAATQARKERIATALSRLVVAWNDICLQPPTHGNACSDTTSAWAPMLVCMSCLVEPLSSAGFYHFQTVGKYLASQLTPEQLPHCTQSQRFLKRMLYRSTGAAINWVTPITI